MDLLINILSLISSAGGGGSSSGGGGGGGGGSSSGSGGGGSGGPGDSLFLCLIPTLFVVSWVKARYTAKAYRQDDKSILDHGKTVCVLVSVVLVPVFAVIATALYVSELKTSSVGSYIFGFIVSCVFGAVGALLGYSSRSDPYIKAIRARDAAKRTRAQLAKAAANDAIWNDSYLQQGVQKVFMAYQKDWSNLDAAATKAYLTPRYYEHASLMLEAFKDAHRCNKTNVIQYQGSQLLSFTDNADNSQDAFNALVVAQVDDRLYDSDTNMLLDSSNYVLRETWRFQRIGNSWYLDGINPSTEAEGTRAGKIQRFAEQHGAFYSLDWGRMLLPQRGEIFKSNSFKVADVNNHVIGRMQSTNRAVADDVVYQIYTYSAKPYYQSRAKDVYLIGQLAVPKRYGNILIVRRSKAFRVSKSGRVEMQFESSEFNDKYRVLADSAEQVTSFELLHPAMLQTLIDAPFEISIEVIDNIIYFYAPLGETRAEHYEQMLSILQAAYRELKL